MLNFYFRQYSLSKIATTLWVTHAQLVNSSPNMASSEMLRVIKPVL